MATFYDTHAHLDYPEYAPDFAQVLERAQAAGIARLLSIGTNLESSRRAVALADLLPNEMAPAIAGMIDQGMAAMKRTLEG